MTATPFDTRFIAFAKDRISKYGKSITFYPVVDDVDGSTYDVNTGTIPEGDETAITTKCIVGVVGKTSRTGQDVARQGVRQADHLIYVPAADFPSPPKDQDEVLFDNVRWKVLAIEFFYSGELAAMYGVYIKKP